MGNSSPFHVDIMALNNEVTGSCFQLVTQFPNGTSKTLLFDCGLFHETESAIFNKSFPFNPCNIDYVVVTHNHVDHTGRLPLLVKKGYRGDIHMTYTTSKLIDKALEDSCKVLRNKAKLAHEPQLYTDVDVEETLKHVKGHPYEESIWLDNNFKLTFFMNGHLPGAASILLQIKYKEHFGKHYEDINILFTGDYNNKNIFFDPNPIPKWVHQLPITIIQEATYGDMDSSEIEYVFEDNILNALAQNKEIVIPVFSLGRSQEIIYLLKKLQDAGKLSKSIPIYYDGKLGIRYTALYLKDGLDNKEECKKFLPENFAYITSSEERDAIIADGKTKIILTTSGMGSYGPAQTYLPAYLRKPNALIHFTGYVAKDTLGRRLYDCQKDTKVQISGLQVKKLADVRFTTEFSAHAKADELLDFLRPFENIKLLLINHGEEAKKEAYANKVIDEIDPKAVGILGRQYFYRVDGYGLIKSLPTKF